MQMIQDRRRLLAALSSAAAAGLLGGRQSCAQEPKPETTSLRLSKIPGICVAPQYVAEELLKAEGFTNIDYFEVPTPKEQYVAFAAGKYDMTMAFVAPFILQVDAGVPLVLLGGIHAGCFELFGTEHVRSIRDLKGKTVALPDLGGAHHIFLASMAAYVGVDANRDIKLRDPVCAGVDRAAGAGQD